MVQRLLLGSHLGLGGAAFSLFKGNLLLDLLQSQVAVPLEFPEPFQGQHAVFKFGAISGQLEFEIHDFLVEVLQPGGELRDLLRGFCRSGLGLLDFRDNFGQRFIVFGHLIIQITFFAQKLFLLQLHDFAMTAGRFEIFFQSVEGFFYFHELFRGTGFSGDGLLEFGFQLPDRGLQFLLLLLGLGQFIVQDATALFKGFQLLLLCQDAAQLFLAAADQQTLVGNHVA